MTPLHLAALHDAPLPVLRALLRGGADPRAVDAERDTAAEVGVVCCVLLCVSSPPADLCIMVYGVDNQLTDPNMR